MKRIMIVTAVLVFMTSGFAFSGETAGAGKAKPYNGITYFETGVEPDCANPGTTVAAPTEKKMFNGITFFDSAPTGSGARGTCAGSSATLASAKKTFNGVTVF